MLEILSTLKNNTELNKHVKSKKVFLLNLVPVGFKVGANVISFLDLLSSIKESIPPTL